MKSLKYSAPGLKSTVADPFVGPCRRRREKSVRMAMETPSDEQPERWARRSDVQQLLGCMLAVPHGDHREAIWQVLEGGLLNGHVAGLFAVAESIDFKKPLWSGALAKSKAAAYHTWLFHLLGGVEQKLVEPPVCLGGGATNFSAQLRLQAMPAYQTKKEHRGRFWLELHTLTDAARQGRMTPAQEQQLHELRFSLVDAAWLRLPAAEGLTSRSAASGGGGEPAPGSEAEQQQRTNELMAFAMGTHSRLGEGYASREGPCAVRVLAGNLDMLRLVADFVRGRPRRMLQPPDRELLRLRRLNWHMELELQAAHAAKDAHRLAFEEVERESGRERLQHAAAVERLAEMLRVARVAAQTKLDEAVSTSEVCAARPVVSLPCLISL